MRKSRHVQVFIIALVCVLAFGPVGAASAGGGPVRVRAPFIPFTISGVCTFDVYWEALADNGYYKIFTDQDATRYILTGVLKSRLTNLQTGQSVDLANNSRYAQVFYNDGASSFTSNGPAIWFGMPGLEALMYVRGKVSFEFDLAGNLIKSVVKGNVENLCETLGD